MTTATTGRAIRDNRVWRTLGVLMVLLALAGRLEPASVAARHGEAPLDLAALSLVPADLEEIGWEGFGTSHGLLLTPEQEAARIAQERDLPDADVLEILSEAGLVRSYGGQLSLPIETETYTLTFAAAWTYFEFEDEEGAADAFPFLSDAEADPTAEEVEEVEGGESIGDESVVVRWTTTEPWSGVPIRALMLGFRTDRIVALVGLFDIKIDGEGPGVPAVADAEALAARALERIEDGLDGGRTPGLSTKALRLAVDDPATNVAVDRYEAMGGEPIRNLYDIGEEERIADWLEWEGMVDVYEVELLIPAGRRADPADPYYSVELTRFEDEAAAEAWLVDGAMDEFSSEPYIADFEPVEVDELGDGSLAAAIEDDWNPDTIIAGHVVFVRVGTIVVEVVVASGAGVDLEVAVELAEEQTACLDGDDGCPEPVAVPDELLEE